MDGVLYRASNTSEQWNKIHYQQLENIELYLQKINARLDSFEQHNEMMNAKLTSFIDKHDTEQDLPLLMPHAMFNFMRGPVVTEMQDETDESNNNSTNANNSTNNHNSINANSFTNDVYKDDIAHNFTNNTIAHNFTNKSSCQVEEINDFKEELDKFISNNHPFGTNQQFDEIFHSNDSGSSNTSELSTPSPISDESSEKYNSAILEMNNSAISEPIIVTTDEILKINKSSSNLLSSIEKVELSQVMDEMVTSISSNGSMDDKSTNSANKTTNSANEPTYVSNEPTYVSNETIVPKRRGRKPKTETKVVEPKVIKAKKTKKI
jgi:hypothetical protein